MEKGSAEGKQRGEAEKGSGEGSVSKRGDIREAKEETNDVAYGEM